MTLQQLKYALTIAECGSMNEAAKQLFLSQQAVSKQVAEPVGDHERTGDGDRL